MNIEEFSAASGATRMQERAISMARMVLVDGVKPAVVGRQFGVSRQAAQRAAARVVRAGKRSGGIPDKWETVTLTLSPEVIRIVKYLHSRESVREGVNTVSSVAAPEVSQGTALDIGEVLAKWRNS